MAESIKELLEEIRNRLSDIEACLPDQIDILAVSPRSKLPFKALTYRGTLIWRMAELSRTAYEAFKDDKLASAILLTRGAVETCAALWYLRNIVSAAPRRFKTLVAAEELQKIGSDRRVAESLYF